MVELFSSAVCFLFCIADLQLYKIKTIFILYIAAISAYLRDVSNIIIIVQQHIYTCDEQVFVYLIVSVPCFLCFVLFEYSQDHWLYRPRSLSHRPRSLPTGRDHCRTLAEITETGRDHLGRDRERPRSP